MVSVCFGVLFFCGVEGWESSFLKSLFDFLSLLSLLFYVSVDTTAMDSSIYSGVTMGVIAGSV